MTRRIGWAAFSAASLAVCAGCTEETSPADGSGGSGAGGANTPAPSSSDVSTSAATTSASTSMTSTSASSSSGGEPCAPLENADDPSPTPGHCDDGVAVTCAQDGFLTSERCDGGTECREYELSEWRFDGQGDPPAWVPARTIAWAGCVPAGAETCPREWDGNNYTWIEPPHCEGTSKAMCLGMPAPDLTSNLPQLKYGGEEGFLSVVDCPNGEKCAGSDTIDQLTCIDVDTPACDGSEPSCSGDGIEWCAGTWESLPGYEMVGDCALDWTCSEGTAGPFCQQPGEVPCDGAAFTTTCNDDATAIVTCYQGWTNHQSCAACWDGNQQVPCRCDVLASPNGWSWSGNELECFESQSLACVPLAAADCDPPSTRTRAPAP